MEKLLIGNVYEQVYHKDLFQGPFFFLIYINDLATDLKSNVKLFADDTSLFSIVSAPLETASILNEDLDKIRRWAEQWKMASNPDPTKQAQKVVFSKKTQIHLDYVDIIDDQQNNFSLCNKIGTCQYNAALAITGAIRGSSKERLYQELGFEYLSCRKWLRKLCTFYKIVRNKSPGYLCQYILPGDCAIELEIVII